MMSEDEGAFGVTVAYLRCALDVGVIDVAAVIQWADATLATLQHPPYALIELALMSRSSREEVMWQLLQVAAPAIAEDEMLPYVLSVAHSRLLGDPAFRATPGRGHLTSMDPVRLRLTRHPAGVRVF